MNLAGRLAAAVAAALPSVASGAFSFDSPRWSPSAALSLPVLHGASGDPFPSPPVLQSARPVVPGIASDTYDPVDLWAAETLVSRRTDQNGNTLWIARFRVKLPPRGAVMSYEDWEGWKSRADSAFDASSLHDIAEAAASVSPAAIDAGPEKVSPRNPAIETLLRFESSECPAAQLYAFLPRRTDWTDGQDWRFAGFVPAPGTDPGEAREAFENGFIARLTLPGKAYRTPPAIPGEDVLPADGYARRKAIHSMFAEYPEWTVSDAKDVTVAANLPSAFGAPFVDSLTNNLPRLREAYSGVLRGTIPRVRRGEENDILPPPPRPSLAFVRVFAGRRDYLAYLEGSTGQRHENSAAVWMPARRELVLNLEDADRKDGLLSVTRHEAFHQFLFYAAGGAESPPWFNEGLAEAFAGSRFTDSGAIEFLDNEAYCEIAKAVAADPGDVLSEIFTAGYERFYSGTSAERTVRYAVAWSIFRFLLSPEGAPSLNGAPFRSVVPRCFSAIRDGQSAPSATLEAFGGADGLEDFIYEWRRWWREK